MLFHNKNICFGTPEKHLAETLDPSGHHNKKKIHGEDKNIIAFLRLISIRVFFIYLFMAVSLFYSHNNLSVFFSLLSKDSSFDKIEKPDWLH